MADNTTPTVQPQITFIFELVSRLMEGEIQIPRFQRAFVWRPKQVLDLLDSIRLQYPIGSLLAWQTGTPVRTLDRVGPIDLRHRKADRPSFLLDGHQRLSTMAGALTSRSNREEGYDEIWDIAFNASDETFEHYDRSEPLAAHLFPMSGLVDTNDFLDECQRIFSSGDAEARLYVDRVRQLLAAFQNYKIPVIEIQKTEAREAVEIFARLNSKGQAMTADQMVSALLYSDETGNSFDLSSDISALSKLLEDSGFKDFSRDHILRALLACVGEDIYRTDWTRISADRRGLVLERMREALPSLSGAVRNAIDFLRTLGVMNDRLLPYALQVVVLTGFFYVRPEPTADQIAFLQRWFWVSSFTEWFGRANPSRVNALVREMLDIVARDPHPESMKAMDLKSPAVALGESFDLRSARTKSMLLVMIDHGPLDVEGRPISQVQDFIHESGSRALAYAVDSASPSLRSSPANRVLTYNPSMRGQARTWLLSISSDLRARVGSSHGITEAAYEALSDRNHDEFLRLRLDEIKRLEGLFLKSKGVSQPVGNDHASDVAIPAGFGFDSDDREDDEE